MIESSIPISDYNYPLDESRIAKFPLEKRDITKLLVLKNGQLTDSFFYELDQFIPAGSLLIFNNTKVIKARLVFAKEGGARIEVFCLNKVDEGNGFATWNCYVGNSKRWKNQELTLRADGNIPALTATRISTQLDISRVRFTWDDSSFLFDDILDHYGKVPLPPYLNREPIDDDTKRYQTIYARYDGSVAAPTAGLHFTQKELDSLKNKHCQLDYVTLHVGAGTFKPVTSTDAREHAMHEEKIIIHGDTILRLIQNPDKTIIPVGTTSMRSLESIYWLGYQLATGQETALAATGLFSIDQWEPYQAQLTLSSTEALQAVYHYMMDHKLSEISGLTRIMIVPGYQFKICKALITNFHQPQSTLLLLVAAFIGDSWKQAYQHALDHDYRFLSYGDSCLFFPPQ